MAGSINQEAILVNLTREPLIKSVLVGKSIGTLDLASSESWQDQALQQRFFRQIQVDLSNGCWNWIGVMNSNGYGRFSFRNKYHLAHRFFFENYLGPISHGFNVCHRCDNRRCVNPAHLWLGTQSQNLSDAAAKNRMFRPDTTGEYNGNRKLDWSKVREIRRLLLGGTKKSQVAKQFDVSPTTITYISNNSIWKDTQNAE